MVPPFVEKRFLLKQVTGLSFFYIGYLIAKNLISVFFYNKVVKTVRLAFFVLFCINLHVIGQTDPQFSQYMFNPLVINPGYAGSSGHINAVAINRSQWVGMPGAPRTTVVGGDMSINLLGNQGGVGFLILNDEIGFFRNVNIQASLSNRFEVGDGNLGVGMFLGFINQVLDGTKLVSNPEGGGSYHQSTDNIVPGAEVNGTAFDTGLGAYFKNNRFQGGISVLHLFQPKPNFNGELDVYIPRTVFITGGYNYGLWEYPLVFKPSFLLKGVGNLWQLDININAVYRDKFWGGLSYRLQDAIVVMSGIEMASGLKIGYSYDITTSKISKVTGGSHEIMVGYTFDISFDKRDKKYKSVRYL